MFLAQEDEGTDCDCVLVRFALEAGPMASGPLVTVFGLTWEKFPAPPRPEYM